MRSRRPGRPPSIRRSCCAARGPWPSNWAISRPRKSGTEELLELGRARGDARVITGSLATLASVAVQEGDLERARTLSTGRGRRRPSMRRPEHVDVGRPRPRGDRSSKQATRRQRASTSKKSSNWRASYETHGARSIALVSLSLVAFLEGDTDERCGLPRRLPAARERSRRKCGDPRMPGGIGRGRRATR